MGESIDDSMESYSQRAVTGAFKGRHPGVTYILGGQK